ncbi:Lrp/AsnC family transcriptional regulator [Gordonia sp. C13]|uniref:Lrp/AsnC family transcriptional regulator n=1 Tax=Gordonia sp. C13 TaxID=2935078 RepID=UPI00200B35E1|nr:Lrp/AsnC family transcriptional regulator [Gordonia sp. C13]MCK8613968.1 Lrp/AsnC family transcriptional regulator [Gordonia sp. C13]
MPDDLDYQIVHALQVAPRAPWGVVGDVVGVSAATAARRWERLVDRGLAWIVTYPGAAYLNTRCSAFVEVQASSRREALVECLSRDRHVATIQRTAGDSDLLLTVMVPDLGFLGDWVQRLAETEGVARTRTRVVMRVFGESERWRVHTLSDADESVLAEHRPERRPLAHEPDDMDLRLIAALAEDGRRSAVDLAAVSGLSAPTVRRRLTALVAERVLSIRCEVAHVISGWPVTANVWARASSRSISTLVDALDELPQVRVCCEVTGTANILMGVWLHTVGELSDFEQQLESRVPGLVVADRSVTLETPKRLGSLLDRSGCRAGSVPVVL